MTGQRTYRRITAAELPAWRERHPQALVLDARDATHHARDALPGALCLGRDNQDALLLRTDRRRPVLIYCHHGRASQTWAQMFADFGFTEVVDLIGGHAAWLAQAQAAARPADLHVVPPAASTRPVAPALASWLAQQGLAGPEARGAHGNTPLMLAAWRGQADAVQALLAHGVALDATNADGNNALWLACVHGEPALIERLVRAGVPLDHANKVGATCLMYASSAGKTPVLRTLLALGADWRPRTQDDFTALDMAANLECLQLLREAERRARPALVA
ncbi:ankyrin repeat domain-containing protein [uncultured Pseudacidovorax sp.]|uniref:ankyrin repeat domain-containing protein n=1 Tax=uncultured Pseudacidovorax sp. TaxID=679313 RepID=UPI0025DA4FDB|nr:ankyrin repeat domain-containing protein [uncultured Pseudacidovorax sp.]